MHILKILVLFNIVFLIQLNAQNEKKDNKVCTYKLEDLKSKVNNKEHKPLLKFIQSIYKSKIQDWEDMEGMKHLESDEFMILPMMKKVDEMSDNPGLYTVASANNVKVNQRIFNVREPISCSYYLLYSLATNDKKTYVIFSGRWGYKRFYQLYSTSNLQEFLSKINDSNLLKIFDKNTESHYGLQKISEYDVNYFLIINKHSKKNYIVSVPSMMNSSWNIFTLEDDKIQKIIHILDNLLGKPNPSTLGTAPYSETNILTRRRAESIVKNCALRPWANLDYKEQGYEKFNTIDHIFKRLEEISTNNWLVRKQFTQLKEIIPKARHALQLYYKKQFSYDHDIVEKYSVKNLDTIICSYFSFDR